ncbi:MAG: hypothetical protein F4066_00205 [Chloroflexi bacterium]|nr:hypothetical protein [Chloroflexota bacterium]
MSAVGAPSVDAVVAGGTPTRFTERRYRQADLIAARSFDVFVRAFDGNGKLLAASSARTCEGPCEVAVSNVSATGLRVAWTALDPDILIHHVRVRSGERVLAQGYGSHRRYESLSGLKLAGETTYTAEVRLFSGTRGGYTPWAGVEFTTPEAPKPDPVTLLVTPSSTTCLTGESVTVSWSVTGGSG